MISISMRCSRASSLAWRVILEPPYQDFRLPLTCSDSLSSGNVQPYLPYHLYAVVDKYSVPGTCYNDQEACIGDGVKSERKVGRTMSRKSKQSKHKKKFTTSLPQVDKYLDLIGHQIFQGNYTGAVAN